MLSIVPSILASSSLALPVVASHRNRQDFRGVLATVDVPSDKPPSGARGHRVTLTTAAVEDALPSLVGMGLDYTLCFDGHDARRKIGVITEAALVRLATVVVVQISGFLYAKDFPEVIEEIRKNGDALGMSYEIADARVRSLAASVWTIDDFCFTGAALLAKNKAAYRDTSIELVE